MHSEPFTQMIIQSGPLVVKQPWQPAHQKSSDVTSIIVRTIDTDAGVQHEHTGAQSCCFTLDHLR